jgi:Holliday junction resolvase
LGKEIYHTYCKCQQLPVIIFFMRYAARIDDNQNEIVSALRKAGATVRVVTQGGGLPDLLVGYQGKTILMEVKDGNKVPSGRKLTEAEQKFFNDWRGGLLVIVNSVEEALETLEKCG